MKKKKRRGIIQKINAIWLQYKKEKMAVLGLAILIAIFLVAIAAPYISTYNPYMMSNDILKQPSSNHFFGTDTLGRDVFSRVVWGSQVSIMFGICVSSISMIIGVTLGGIAGYYGRYIDDLLSRFFEAVIIIPTLFLIIVAVALFSANFYLEMVIIGLTLWPLSAKMVRSQVLTIKEREFVKAAIVVGAGTPRIIFRHILPHSMPPVIANATLQAGYAIMIEAGLSFLGLGDPNQISWGAIIHEALIYTRQWWLAVFPGIAIVITVLGWSLVGDGIIHTLVQD